MRHCKFSITILSFFILLGCDNNEMEENYISVLAISANGSTLTHGAENLAVDLELSVVFDAILDREQFESAFSLKSENEEVPVTISYANSLSKVIVTGQLAYATEYTLYIGSEIIAPNARRLKQPLMLTFSTRADDVVRSMPPCSSGCKRTVNLSGENAPAQFEYYSNYPIYNENAEWEKLTSAVIVVHGQNRDADNYFSYLSTSLKTTGLSENTVLISPWFKDEAAAGENQLYWGSGWREGLESDNGTKLSSFAAVDSLIKQLANKDRFPVLERIVVTGHSSGALFTHVYAGANKSESRYPGIDFTYVAANSQYFYYPGDYRYNEQTHEFYQPGACFDFNYWPAGYQNVPAYLNGFSKEDFDSQFTQRKITYLLGNGEGNDPALNTTDCRASLLGSSRYQRGENIFMFMNQFYPDHAHSRIIVNGIGHNGKGMYESSEFSSLITQLFDK